MGLVVSHQQEAPWRERNGARAVEQGARAHAIGKPSDAGRARQGARGAARGQHRADEVVGGVRHKNGAAGRVEDHARGLTKARRGAHRVVHVAPRGCAGRRRGGELPRERAHLAKRRHRAHRVVKRVGHVEGAAAAHRKAIGPCKGGGCPRAIHVGVGHCARARQREHHAASQHAQAVVAEITDEQRASDIVREAGGVGKRGATQSGAVGGPLQGAASQRGHCPRAQVQTADQIVELVAEGHRRARGREREPPGRAQRRAAAHAIRSLHRSCNVNAREVARHGAHAADERCGGRAARGRGRHAGRGRGGG